jgi:Family of unknown function (DUF6404)
MSTFESRRSEALRLLAATGIKSANYLPPAVRILWRFGVEVPPPHFMPFGKSALAAGTAFGFGWGTVMYLLSLFIPRLNFSVQALSVASLAVGVLFGLSMATYYAFGRRRNRLPEWESLGSTGGAA